jgi:molybdenum-dependent DNA-binding transcriptional regulator ModE
MSLLVELVVPPEVAGNQPCGMRVAHGRSRGNRAEAAYRRCRKRTVRSTVDTRHVRAVVAIAEHGSFTRAARNLFMAQSTLSRQVGALERHLGIELFNRGPRTVTLTAEGSAFLSHARKILDAVGDAEKAAGRPQSTG